MYGTFRPNSPNKWIFTRVHRNRFDWIEDVPKIRNIQHYGGQKVHELDALHPALYMCAFGTTHNHHPRTNPIVTWMTQFDDSLVVYKARYIVPFTNIVIHLISMCSQSLPLFPRLSYSLFTISFYCTIYRWLQHSVYVWTP